MCAMGDHLGAGSLYHVGCGDGSQVARHAVKHLYLVSHQAAHGKAGLEGRRRPLGISCVVGWFYFCQLLAELLAVERRGSAAVAE